jgi:hypothetical protein
MKVYPYQSYDDVSRSLLCAAQCIERRITDEHAQTPVGHREVSAQQISGALSLTAAMSVVTAAEECLNELPEYGRAWLIVSDATAAARVLMDTAGSVYAYPAELASRLARSAIRAYLADSGP